MTLNLTKKKKIWILVAALAVVLAAAVTAGAIFLPGLLGRSPADPHVRWYSEEKMEYVITTADELYDMAYLSSKYDFHDQTFTLGADIVINEGNAEDWATNAPGRLWYPINGFSGTFDGQGHTISGLYAKAFNEDIGLFANTTRHAVVKNLKVTNSYIWSSGEHGTGVIAANGAGTFDSIYTDAIIWSDNWNNGGIIGKVDVDGDTAINNCWFDGQMILKSDQGRVAGGMVGDIMPASGVCTITHCLSTGEFSAEAITNTSRGRLMDIGGIVGRASTGTTNISDCFSNSTFDSGCMEGVGDVIGSAGKSTTNISHTYSVSDKENIKSVGYRYNKTVGDTYVYPEETLVGYGAYKWTTLDFKDFWAVDMDGTPILKTFADEVPSLDGVVREIDTSWYTKRNTYTIENYKQLLGLHVVSQWDNMSGKTIYLGADITINEGDASEWRENAPEIMFKRISSANTMFAGIFDGLGHTISGVYYKSSANGGGFFTATTDGATVRNFRLVNSYFECDQVAAGKGNYSYTGSIAAYARGTTFDRVYSNAIVVNDGYQAGGLVGLMRNGKASIMTNCWFDGEVHMHGDQGMRGGGMIGMVWNTTLSMSHCLFTGEMTGESWAWGANEGIMVGYPNAKSVVIIEDSLCAGSLTVLDGKADGNGMLCGRIAADASVTFDDAFAIKCKNPDPIEGAEKQWVSNWGLTGFRGAPITCTGPAAILDEKYVNGYAAYQYTSLDFENYWAVDPDGHPVLKAFMAEDEVAPDLSGYSKLADYSWYNSADTEYYIANREQLVALSLLSTGDPFKEKTVYLTANVTLNSGNAANWDNRAPAYEWVPIGNASVMFQGTFNGMGHTVKGLYVSEPTNGLGMFGMIKNATIKNLRLTNSFIESNMAAKTKAEGKYTNYSYIGGIAAYAAKSTFDTIYTDVIIKNDGEMTGGIVGLCNTVDHPVTLNKCWFDGTIIQDYSVKKKDGSLGACFAGGLIALLRNNSATITHCLSSATFVAQNIPDNTWGTVTGGFVGRVDQTGKNPGGKLTIKDSLSNITVQGYPNTIQGNGSVIAQANPNTGLSLTDVYAVASLWPAVGVNRTENKNQTVTTLILPKISGANAYNWTTLNFKSYWNAIEGSTPVLKAFSSGKVANAADAPADPYAYRTPDTSWYSDDQTEFVITTMQQMLGFAELSKTKDFAGKTVKLGADIAFNYCLSSNNLVSGSNVSADADPWTPIGSTSAIPFRGVFDGQGHTVSGLVNTATGHSGLFAFVEDAFIQNVTIERSTFRGGSGGGDSAALVAVASGNTTIKRIMVADDVRLLGASYVGAIVARNKGNLVIDNVWANHFYNGQWIGGVRAGGIVGMNDTTANVTISNALYTGNMEGTVVGAGDNSSAVGGLIGLAPNGGKTQITDSLVAAKMNLLGFDNGDDRNFSGFFGSVIGSKSWTPANTVMEDVYATVESFNNLKWNFDKSEAESIGYHGTVRPDQAFDSGVYQVKNADILGNLAKTNASGLDYTNIWMTRSGKVPALRNPSSGEATPAPITTPSNLEIDLSWYDKSATEYVLMDIADLNGFAVLSQENSFKDKIVKLGADITLNTGDAADWATTAPEYEWVPAAKATFFQGTFDGQGHTISGLYTHSENNYATFIGTAKGATIKNLKLVNSYFNAEVVGAYNVNTHFHTVAGVVGRVNAGTTMESVYTDAILVGGRHAGMLGFTDDGAGVTVKNCWFDGSLTVNVPTDSRGSGGIMGQVINTQTSTFENCLVTGTITGGADGTFVGGIVGMGPYNAEIIMTNCLFAGDMTGVNAGNYGSVIGNNPGANFSKYSGVYADKDACTNLKGAGGATFPVEGVTKASLLGNQATVTLSGYDFTDVWVTVENGTPELRTFSTSTGATDVPVADPNTLTTDWYNDTDTEFTISTVGELKGFVKLANEGNTFDGKTIKLGADIAWNTGTASAWGSASPENVWTPIASFKGTLDGQGHTLSGLYYKLGGTANNGLFSVVENATIKNLVIANSHMESTAGSGNNGILAAVAKGVTVENVKIENTVTVLGATSTGMIGIADGANAVTLRKVWMAGTVKNSMWTAQTGGMLGFVSNVNGLVVTVEDCLFTGTVSVTHESSTANNYAGGFVGGVGADAEINVKNVLSAGTVTFANTSSATNYGGSVVGITSWRGADYASFENAYASNECYKVGTYREPSMYTGTIVRTAKANLLGNLAKTNAPNLDYVNTWVTVDNSTPELRYFSDSTGATDTPVTPEPPTPPSDPNAETTAWFDGTKTVYTISTVGELKGFVKLSESNNFSGVTVKLGADITWNDGNAADWATTAPANEWTAIADGNPFAGTFDGDGHTISGLYAKKTNNRYASLFGHVYGGTVKNVKITNSYLESVVSGTFNTDTHFHCAAAIIGRVGQGAKFESIYTDAILVGGRHAGLVAFQDHNSAGPTIKNCWFDGSITVNVAPGDKGGYGGIMGFARNSQITTLENCLSTGTFIAGAGLDNSYIGGLVGMAPYSAEVKMTKCLSAGDMSGVVSGVAGSVIGNNPGGDKSIYTNVYATSETFTALAGANGDKAGFTATGVAKADILGNLATAKLTGFDFPNTWVTVTGKTPELTTFSTSGGAPGTPEPPATGWYGDGSATEFTISTADDLKDFASKVNGGNTFAGKTVKLGADISLNTGNAADWATTAPANDWTPIGTSSAKFSGTFDGNGKTISGLYKKATVKETIGLFGYVEGATIKNLKVENSYLHAANYHDSSLGAIAAIAFSSTFENILVDKNVTVLGAQNLGGIVGMIDSTGAVTFKQCQFSGTVDITGANPIRSGGIFGFPYKDAKNIVLTDCLFDGTVTGVNTNTNVDTASYGGGLFGMGNWNNTINVTNCLTVGTVDVTANGGAGNIAAVTSGGGGGEYHNVYYLIGATHMGNPDKVKTGSTISAVDKSTLLGDAATSTLAGFNFTNTWTTVDGKTPVLKAFASTGSGTPEPPETDWYGDGSAAEFTLKNVDDFLDFASKVNGGNTFASKTVKLGADIALNTGNAADWATTAPDNKWTPMTSFKGILDGQGHTISGLYCYNDTASANVGLFATTEAATIKNLKVANSYLISNKGSTNMGILVGKASGVTIENVYVGNDVSTVDGVNSGLVAITAGTNAINFKNVWMGGNIVSKMYQARSGGLLGATTNASGLVVNIEDCLFTGTVSSTHATTANENYAGGFAGGITADVKLNVKNVLSVGTINIVTTSEKTCKGSIIGNTSWRGASYTNFVNAYGANETYPVGTYRAETYYTGTITQIAKANLLGELAKTYASGLDYEKVWKTVDGKTPELRYVAEPIPETTP